MTSNHSGPDDSRGATWMRKDIGWWAGKRSVAVTKTVRQFLPGWRSPAKSNIKTSFSTQLFTCDTASISYLGKTDQREIELPQHMWGCRQGWLLWTAYYKISFPLSSFSTRTTRLKHPRIKKVPRVWEPIMIILVGPLRRTKHHCFLYRAAFTRKAQE